MGWISMLVMSTVFNFAFEVKVVNESFGKYSSQIPCGYYTFIAQGSFT